MGDGTAVGAGVAVDPGRVVGVGVGPGKHTVTATSSTTIHVRPPTPSL